MRFELDSGGRHFLQFRPDGGWQASLHHSMGDRRSILHDALGRHLKLVINDAVTVCLGPTDAARLPGDTATVDVRLADLLLGRVELSDAAQVIGERYYLSPFESRFLADHGRPHPSAASQRTSGHGLATDLHVHFAGCISPADLVRIGRECRVAYPRSFLAEVGIHVEADGDVPLADLPDRFLEQVQAQMSIPLDRRIPFVEMERIYRLRRPITKSRAAFLPLLRQIARDYAAMGVQYAELSLSDIVEADRLRLVHRELPAIEREFGITLRFLAALGRHDDLEWDLDLIERIASLGGSRYIAGVDFMGHENNSTHDFSWQLRELAQWADNHRPGFTIRVHAGENPAFPENVRVAVDEVAGQDVQLRIGHGLYGVDDATLDLLRQTGTIVEFNLNSNLALNNIQSALDAPIVRYLKHGIAVVLGTDGYGIYQTTPELEARAAMLCGVRPEDLDAIRTTEARYLQHRRRRDEGVTVDPAVYEVPDDLPHRHYVPEVLERKAQAIRQRNDALASRLSALAIPLLDRTAVDELLRGRKCISIAGAWNKSWDALGPDHQQTIREEIAKLLDGLSSERTALLTGGTRLGVEGVVQALAVPRGFVVVGTIVNETPPDWLEAGAITHAYIVGERLYDKAAGLYTLVKEHNGLCLFIGGGSIVSDEIQTALNLRLRYLLMDGPPGASTEHARQRPQHAFRIAEQVLELLRRKHAWGGTSEPYWHTGPNPTVDIVVTRRAPGTQARQVLLIRRDLDAPTEGGKWALPGGFQQTTAPRGTPWRADVETARQACVRELREETGLVVESLVDELIHVRDYEGPGRDPRDTSEAWSRTEAFAIELADDLAMAPLCGADDACDARWFSLDQIPTELAFDHARILADALAVMTNPRCP